MSSLYALFVFDWRRKVSEFIEAFGWQRRVEALKTLPEVLLLLWRSAPGIVTGGIALRVASALIPVAVLTVTRRIVDLIVNAKMYHGAPGHFLWPWLLLEFALAVFALSFARAIEYCDVRTAAEFTRELSLRVMKHTADVDLASLEDPAFHDKLERARVQATDRVSMLHSVGSLFQAIIMMLALAAGVASYAPWLLALMFLCVLPAFAGESSITFEGFAMGRALTPMLRELDYLRMLGSSRESAKEVKMFGLDGYLRGRYSSLSDVIMHQTRAIARRRFRWGSLLGALASLGYYGGYSFLVFEAFSGRITLGTMTFLAGAVAGANLQLQTIFTLFSSVADQTMFLTDVIDFLRVEPTIVSKPNALPVARPLGEGLEFRNVSFRYPGTDRWILRDFNLKIRPDERIALVGENGQGKTTLVKLITRLYEPVEGEILLDGIDVREYRVEELRREIGVIFQDFFRYDLPVRDNIAVGRVDLIHDDEAIWTAAERTRASRIIDRLPGGLEQMLGRRFEGGIDLSGGQWQKIALARAYIRNAQILILDEPTASLDAAAEAEVFDRFAELTRGRMALLISHRFSTVKMADRIVVLEDGHIKESGTHMELIAQGGQYAQLFELQASNYR